MTDTEKLNKLVDYIRDAERYRIDKVRREPDIGIEGVCAIQDICLYMENELGIEYIQLPSKLERR